MIKLNKNVTVTIDEKYINATIAPVYYVWSILLCRSLGEENSETVLNAHENNPREPIEEQAMDLANSRLGLLNFQKNKDKFKTDEEIKISFIEQLKGKKFVIIKPSYSETGGLP